MNIKFKNIDDMVAGVLPNGQSVKLVVGTEVSTQNAKDNLDDGGATYLISKTILNASSEWYALSNGLYAILKTAGPRSTASRFELPVSSANYVYPALDENQTVNIDGISAVEMRDPAGAYTYFQKSGVKIHSEIEFDNSSTGTQNIGELVIPANISQNMKTFTVSIEQLGLPRHTRVDLGLSISRNQERHRFQKLVSSSENVQFEMCKDGATVIRAVNPDDFSQMPDGGAGLVNGLGFVRLQVYITLAEATPTAEITGLKLSIPRVSLKSKGSRYVSCTQRPFGLESAWNVRADWKTRPPALTYNKESTKGFHASGVAGESIITVADTADVRVGDIVTITENRIGHYAPFNNYRNFVNYKYHKDTTSVIGAGVTVLSIDSPTQIKISKPLLNSFEYTSSDYSYKTKFISTVTARHICSVAKGNSIWSKSPVTGRSSSGTINPYTGFVNSYKLNRDSGETRVFTIKYDKWVATNGLVNEVNGTDNYGEEVLNGQFIIDIPVDMHIEYTGGSRNSDKNVIIETPCGRFSIEMFYCKEQTADSLACSRLSVIDKLYDTAASLYENNIKHSLATRAYGGSLVAGLVTEADLSKVPNPIFASNDNELEKMMREAELAIDHAIAIVPPVTTLKSNKHAAGNFYSVTRTTNNPILESVGSGYAVGDLIYSDPLSTPAIDAACAMVVAVDGSGGVTKAEWTIGGQILNAVTDYVTTTTDGYGSGVIFSASNFTESTGTDNQSIYPASVVDNAYNSYNGSLQMGDRLTIDPRIDLHFEWFEKIKAFDKDDFNLNPLHQYAIIWAIKRYGAIVCDVTNSTFLVTSTTHYPYSTSIALERGGYNYPGASQIMGLLVPCDNSGYYTPNLSDIDVAIFR